VSSIFAAKHDLSAGGRAVTLSSLDDEVALPERLASGIAEFDRAIGGGIVAGSAMLVGGLMTIVIVTAITVAGPRIGIVATSAFLIVGQFALAAMIDRLGWFGVEPIALAWPRVLGLVLLAAGAALTLKR